MRSFLHMKMSLNPIDIIFIIFIFEFVKLGIKMENINNNN